MKFSNLVLALTAAFLLNTQGYSQLKKFQKWYIGANIGYAYAPLDDYNDHNAKFVLINDPTGSRGIKPFDLLNTFKPISLDIYFRDSKEIGFRFFTEYYSAETETKTASGSSTFTRSITSLDFGVQVLWFLTQDYAGPQLLLGFGGAIMLPVIRETDKIPQNKFDREYDNISGGAHFSLIALIPVYGKLTLQTEASYRFSRSSTFFEVNSNAPLSADISLTGYMAKAGLVYQIDL